MKLLSQLRLVQFRNYDFRDFAFTEKLVAITGKNGTGKTNLLDAIYYLCFTKSYFQSKEIHNIQRGKEGFRIEGSFRSPGQTDQVVCLLKDGRKSFSENDIAYEKLSAHIGKYCAVMIAPDDIKIINEGSENRRKFFDGIISQADHQYLDTLLNYQRIHGLKHAYLKNIQGGAVNFELLQIYNEQLRHWGELLVLERMKYTELLKQHIQRFYFELSGAGEAIHIQYQPNVPAATWKEHLESIIQKEAYAGRSLAGTHLDEWDLRLNEMPFKTQASQGQKKSLLIALKIAQLKMLADLGKEPFLLLDDIFEKLDADRVHKLFRLIKDMPVPQIFLTHTMQKDIAQYIQPYFKDISHIELS